MVASNADDYAAERQNIFFTANDQTPEDGNLTGQCVTLIKWFMAQMTTVPNPFAARGDARYVGKRLVAEGHAYEVPYAERRRGDIVCMEYGIYGHIYVQLSGGRVFEENVKWSGVRSKIISEGNDSWTVYASRIGSDAETFRHDMHVYRLYSYNEGDDAMSTIGDYEARILIKHIYGYTNELDVEGAIPALVGGESNTVIRRMDATPTADAYQNQIAAWKKAAETLPPDPVGGGLTPDQAASLNRIDQGVQWIKDKLNGIFK